MQEIYKFCRPWKGRQNLDFNPKLDALRGGVIRQELARRYSATSSKVSVCLNELETYAHQAFECGSVKDRELKIAQSEDKHLLMKVAQSSIDCDFLRVPARHPDSK